MRISTVCLVVVLALCVACAPQGTIESETGRSPDGAEATSLLGEPLHTPALDATTRADRQRKLELALEAYDRDTTDPDNLIWIGRRTAYLGRYREAIEIFSRGIDEHPDDARMYRHRGHRRITLRRFDDAIADLEVAARLVRGTPDRVEPDGLPNARNVPTGTLQSNIFYHLGLAHYLNGDLERARAAYAECLEVSRNPDMLVATTHWLYMTLRRLGDLDTAAGLLEPIDASMDIIENHDYHRLLLMYKGELAPETLLAGPDGPPSAAVAYGVANWHRYNGRPEEASRLFREVLRGSAWAPFGYIAAEAAVAAETLARAGDEELIGQPVRRPGTLVIASSVTLLCVIWGTTWSVIQIGLEGIPPLTGVALRFGISAAVLLGVVFVRRIPLGRTRTERRLWLVNGLLGFCVSYGVVYWGEQWVPSGLASVLFATFPLIVTVLAHFALPSESMARSELLGVLVGLAGIGVIFSTDFRALGGPQVALAAGVLLLSPVAAALASVSVKKWGGGIHPLSITAVPMAITGAVMGVLALAFEGRREIVWDTTSIAALLYLALFGSAVTFTLYYWLLSHLRAKRLALVAYLTPVIAVLIGVVRGEPLTARMLAGSILVIGGVALAVHRSSPAVRKSEN